MKLLDIFNEIKMIDNGFDKEEMKSILRRQHKNISNKKFSLVDLMNGTNHEIEHKDVVDGSPSKLEKIAQDHLDEDPNYYDKLEEIE